MKILKILGAIAALLILAFGLGAYLLPARTTAARSITIAATPDKVFPHIVSLKAFDAWSPWKGRDPAMKQDFEGADAGVGAKVTWSSAVPEVGAGSMEITEALTDTRVAVKLVFDGQGEAASAWDLAPDGAGTRVTWSFSCDAGSNPLFRWFGLLMPFFIAQDYDQGLANLKALVEKGG